MPIYDYRCSSCGEVSSKQRKISERKEVQVCDVCGQLSAEFIVSAPRFMFDPADDGFAGNFDKWGRDREAKIKKLSQKAA